MVLMITTVMRMLTEKAVMQKMMGVMMPMDRPNKNILRRNSLHCHMSHPMALILKSKISLLKTADH